MFQGFKRGLYPKPNCQAAIARRILAVRAWTPALTAGLIKRARAPGGEEK